MQQKPGPTPEHAGIPSCRGQLGAAPALFVTTALLLAPATLSGQHDHRRSELPTVVDAAFRTAVTPDEPRRRTVELTMTAEPTRLLLRAGDTTNVYAFNGQVPGPTLELREGDSVIVHFRNRLPEPSTIHWHGLHLPFVADGSPFHPVAPGGQHDYVFTIRPGTAGTYWYHPHPHHRTGYQVAMGLYGAIIVRAPEDPLDRKSVV